MWVYLGVRCVCLCVCVLCGWVCVSVCVCGWGLCVCVCVCVCFWCVCVCVLGTCVCVCVWYLCVCVCPFQDPHRPWSPSRAGSGPDRVLGHGDGLSGKRPRDDSLLPLVIPVSVPVRRQEPSSPDRERAALASSWPLRHGFLDSGLSDHKPSVIVTRRRSLRNSLSESSGQVGCVLTCVCVCCRPPSTGRGALS